MEEEEEGDNTLRETMEKDKSGSTGEKRLPADWFRLYERPAWELVFLLRRTKDT